MIPKITKKAPRSLMNVICSPRNITAHAMVTSGELDIIIVTNETSPLLIAAKYARSPTRVASTASAAINSNEFEGMLFTSGNFLLTMVHNITVPAANSVLNVKPAIELTFFNASFAKTGAIPQQTIPKNARRNTMIFFLLIKIIFFLTLTDCTLIVRKYAL